MGTSALDSQNFEGVKAHLIDRGMKIALQEVDDDPGVAVDENDVAVPQEAPALLRDLRASYQRRIGELHAPVDQVRLHALEVLRVQRGGPRDVAHEELAGG